MEDSECFLPKETRRGEQGWPERTAISRGLPISVRGVAIPILTRRRRELLDPSETKAGGMGKEFIGNQ